MLQMPTTTKIVVSPRDSPVNYPSIVNRHSIPQYLLEGNEEDLKRFWNKGLLGLNLFFRQRYPVKAPLGYRVMRTSRGQPYLEKIPNKEEEKVEDQQVQKEHALINERLSIFAEWDEIEEHYGLGIRLYFDFTRSLIILNLLLLLLRK